MRRSLSNTCAIFLLSLCGALGPAFAGQPAPKEGEIIATLNGEPIYLSEIEENAAFQIFRLRTSIHSLLKKETEELVNRKLLAAEASRRSLTVEDLLQKEVNEKVYPATEKQVDQYIAEHPGDLTKSPDRRSRIKTYLSERARIQRRLDYLASLRAKADFEFLLRLPEHPRMRIEIAGEPWRGTADAPVTLVHFASFTCRFCREGVEKIRRVMEDFPRKVKWVHRNFFNIHDEAALLAAEIGEALHERGSFWDFHDRLFSVQGALTAEQIRQAAREAGLNQKEFDEGRKKGQYLIRVKDDIGAGVRMGVEAVPVIFVNGLYFSGTFPYADLKTLVQKELKRAGNAKKETRKPASK
jgi:hypothetical protein